MFVRTWGSSSLGDKSIRESIPYTYKFNYFKHYLPKKHE